MRHHWPLLLLTLLLFCFPAVATEGMFQGKVVDPPVSEPARKGWIFIEGRNHMLRRVEVAHAEIVYGGEVPASQRHQCRTECLEVGQEVRVLAEQDPSGEWHAKRVEIIRLITNRA